jgi:hypothetical protein
MGSWFGGGGGLQPATDANTNFFDTSGETAMGTSGNIDEGAFDTSGGGAASSGIDWTKLSGALKDASKSLGGTDSGSSKTNLSSGSGVVGQSSSTTGRPTAAVSLDNLMKILQARQQGYASSAMSPQSATPQTQKQTTYGLLGW